MRKRRRPDYPQPTVQKNSSGTLRLVRILLAERDDEWQAGEKAYFSQCSMAKASSSVLPPPDLLKEVATG